MTETAADAPAPVRQQAIATIVKLRSKNAAVVLRELLAEDLQPVVQRIAAEK